jgi:hypothetical protein
MDSTTQTSAEDAKSMSDLFELVEKQRIQLNAKDKELQENRQANEVNAGFIGLNNFFYVCFRNCLPIWIWQ